MNQILDYDVNNKSRKNGGSDNIVRIFAIILIILAIALISVAAYSMFSNKEKISSEAEKITYANISVETNETQATIIVTHDKNIKTLIYSWNSSSERKKTYSEKYIEEVIDIPQGDNTLHIKVIDENGVETTYDEEISSEQGIDIISPIIELQITDEPKLKITATDETALDFITYRWNEEEEETVYAEEGSKEIEIEIEILKGENDLTIVAVDASSNTTTETKSFTGLTQPEITVTLSEDGSSILISATHEKGIESVEYNFNDVDYNVEIGEDDPTYIEFQQNLDVGYNRIIVTVTSVDGISNTFDGQCTYGDSEDNSNSAQTEETNTETEENNT